MTTVRGEAVADLLRRLESLTPEGQRDFRAMLEFAGRRDEMVTAVGRHDLATHVDTLLRQLCAIHRITP